MLNAPRAVRTLSIETRSPSGRPKTEAHAVVMFNDSRAGPHGGMPRPSFRSTVRQVGGG